nr:immunoglobulin heavy chain junction region [Mus musculus]
CAIGITTVYYFDYW